MAERSRVGSPKNVAAVAENRHSYHIFVAFKVHVATMPSALRKKQEEEGRSSFKISLINTTFE